MQHKIEITQDITVTLNEHGQVFIKPAEGITVPLRELPGDRALAAAGDWRPLSQFWVRRLRDKDVIEATPPAATDGAAAKDLVQQLLAGTPDQVSAGLADLSAEALQLALEMEQADQKRTPVIKAIKAAIAGNK